MHDERTLDTQESIDYYCAMKKRKKLRGFKIDTNEGEKKVSRTLYYCECKFHASVCDTRTIN